MDKRLKCTSTFMLKWLILELWPEGQASCLAYIYVPIEVFSGKGSWQVQSCFPSASLQLICITQK